MRACMVQGLQQLWTTALWYWGNKLVSFPSLHLYVSIGSLNNTVFLLEYRAEMLLEFSNLGGSALSSGLLPLCACSSSAVSTGVFPITTTKCHPKFPTSSEPSSDESWLFGLSHHSNFRSVIGLVADFKHSLGSCVLRSCRVTGCRVPTAETGRSCGATPESLLGVSLSWSSSSLSECGLLFLESLPSSVRRIRGFFVSSPSVWDAPGGAKCCGVLQVWPVSSLCPIRRA